MKLFRCLCVFVIILFFLTEPIMALDITPDNIQGQAGDALILPVRVTNPGQEMEIDAFSFIIQFDEAVLTFAGADKTGTVTKDFTDVSGTVNPDDAGMAKITGYLTNDQPSQIPGGTQDAVFVNLMFNVSSTADKDSAFTLSAFKDDIQNAATAEGAFTFIPASQDQPVLSVTPLFPEISSDQGTLTIRIANTGASGMIWTVEEDSGWFSADPTSGTDSGDITINYEANAGGTRTGSLTISCGDALNSPQTVEIRQIERISPPENPEARTGKNTIRLAWAPGAGSHLTGYHLYRSPSGDENYTRITTEPVTENHYTDASNDLTGGTMYDYYLTAVDTFGVESDPSESISAVFGQVKLSIPDAQGKSGTQIRLPVNITNADGLKMCGADIYVTYNPNVLSAADIEETPLSSAYGWTSSLQTEGIVRATLVAPDEKEALFGEGALFFLLFDVEGSEGEMTSLEFQTTGTAFYDCDENFNTVPVSLDLDDIGTFRVEGDHRLGDSNGDSQVNSADIFEILNIAVGNLELTDERKSAGDVSGDGRVMSNDASMVLRLAVGLPLVPESAFQKPTSCNLSVPGNTIIPPGGDIWIPIEIDDATAVMGGDIILNYDPTIVTAADARITSLTEGFGIKVNTEQAGQIRISFSALEGDGLTGGSDPLLEVQFTPQPNVSGTSPLTFASVRLNDTFGRDFATSALQADMKVNNGTLTVKSSYKLSDCILVLKMLTGTLGVDTGLWLDLNGSGKVGIEDVIYVLTHLSE